MTNQIPPSPDTGPAYMGVIIGAVALFVILFGIVKLTNAHFKAAEPPAAATTTQPQ
jgi:hypothetical protein